MRRARRRVLIGASDTRPHPTQNARARRRMQEAVRGFSPLREAGTVRANGQRCAEEGASFMKTPIRLAVGGIEVTAPSVASAAAAVPAAPSFTG
jgi:hypothetical protein